MRREEGVLTVVAAEGFFYSGEQGVIGKRPLQGGIRIQPRPPGEFVDGQIAGGHDDRNFYGGGAQAVNHFDAGHSGHLVVGDDEVVMVGENEFPTGGAVFGGVDFVAGVDEDVDIELTHVVVVVHDENSWWWFDFG